MGVSDQYISASYVSDLTTDQARAVLLQPSEALITLLLPSHPDVGSTLFRTLFPPPPSLLASSSTAPTPPSLPSLPASLITYLKLIHSLLSLPNEASSSRYPPLTIIVSTSYKGVAETSDCTITLASSYVEAQFKKKRATLEEARKEIDGVLCHEMVHVVQEDGQGSAPGWWTEGLADWVRLEGGLGARHWKKLGQGSSWKDAYETTALFLSHLTKHVHPSLCSEINSRLKNSPWSDQWFEELTTKPIELLWKEYKAFYAKEVEGVEVPKAVPTHVARVP